MSLEILTTKKYAQHVGTAPENPSRIEHTIEFLEKEKILSKKTLVEPRKATLQEILLTHSKSYVQAVEELCIHGGGYLDNDTMADPSTHETALLAAGAAIEAAERATKTNHTMALVRPPGHHAKHDHAMGFCVYNNIAIAAETLLKQGKKVALVDIDFHHGNGTQEALLGKKNALFISLHQHPAYPGTGKECEKNAVNIPLPPGTDKKLWLKAFQQIVLPLLEKFSPDKIGVSMGLDAHFMDAGLLWPSDDLRLDFEAFGKIAKEIKNTAPSFWVLEGGYNLFSLAGSVAQIASELGGLGKKYSEPEQPIQSTPTVEEAVKKTIAKVQKTVKQKQ